MFTRRAVMLREMREMREIAVSAVPPEVGQKE
jgi:hypothetical protein